MGKCENCYWNDSCVTKGDICNDYFPIDDFEMKMKEYDDDLHMRYRTYERLIDEYK